MREARTGDTVKVEYTGKLEDGTVFDSSVGRAPLEFTIGSGQVIDGFDRAVTGLKVGEKRTERLAPEEAYGERKEEMIVEIPRAEFPSEISPSVGDVLEVQSGDGAASRVTVSEVREDAIVLDGNHPLAGQALVFDVTLVEIV